MGQSLLVLELKGDAIKVRASQVCPVSVKIKKAILQEREKWRGEKQE